MTKKSIYLALILVIALGTLGIGYGAWTETLNINGNVTTGSFNVSFYNMSVYWQSDYSGVATCENNVTPDGKTMTIAVTNGYPGFECSGAAAIVNTGTVPAFVNGLVAVDPEDSQYFTLELKDTSMTPAPAGFDLAVNPTLVPPYTVYGAVDWTFVMPESEEGGMGQTTTFSYTILAEQGL